MPLLPPLVNGPLSECSDSVVVSGQRALTTVNVYSGGRLVATGKADWGTVRLNLLPGESLKAGEHVVAEQFDGTARSDKTPEPHWIVQSAAPAGPLAQAAPPYGCGEAVWIEGAVPGAVVTAKAGATVLGSARAPRGDAHVRLSTPLAAGAVLAASQTACGAASGDTLFPPPAPPLPEILPPPVVVEPLGECELSITISGVFPGARVTAQRSGGSTLLATFDYPELTIFLTTPLKAGETVTAVQEFPACQRRSPASKPVLVGPLKPVAPEIVGSLCTGSEWVTVGKLRAGLLVRLFADGVELGDVQAPDNGVFQFAVPPLKAGATISARQQFCAVWSDESNKVTVKGVVPFTPIIAGPLFSCAGLVQVDAGPGSWVVLRSTKLGADIGRAFAAATDLKRVEVRVSPPLIAGDIILPVSYGCSQEKGTAVTVSLAPQELPPPKFGVLREGLLAVPVTGILRGARVTVSVDGAWRNTQLLGAESGDIPIFQPLQIGNEIIALQTLCAASPPAKVKLQKPPVASFTASPLSGDVPLRVRFTSTSSGAITSHQWDFDGTSVSSLPNPEFTYARAGVYSAKLTVSGPFGSSSSSVTINASAPSVGFDRVEISNCHRNKASIHIYSRELGKSEWTDLGDMAHQHGEKTCPAGPPRIVPLADGRITDVLIIDKGIPGCTGKPDQPGCAYTKQTLRGKRGGPVFPIPVK